MRATLICLISLMALTSCDQESRLDERDSTESVSFGFVDACTTAPGPNCCALARNGLCEEPLGCPLGTDGEDCRGGLFTVDSMGSVDCSDARLIELEEGLTQVEIPFTWSGQEEELSFTLDPITISLPEATRSVSVSVVDGALDTGLNWTLNETQLRAFNEASAATGALPYHYASEPEAGCLVVWPLVEGRRLDREAQLLVAARGALSDVSSTPILDVNVIVVGETDVTAEELEAMFTVAADIYELNGGPQINITGVFETEGDSLIPSEGDEINGLRSREFGASLRALNVYIIDDFTEGDGTLGIAGGAPGPNGVAPTPASGLVIALEPHLIEDEAGDFILDEALTGSTIAHELGHQLGLDHTTESDGSTRSPITDLESCAYAEIESSEPAECPDGRNLMFWNSGDEPQTQLSSEQVFVLSHNPIIY